MICLTYHDLVFSRASRAHLGTKTVARDRSRLDLHLAAAGHGYLCSRDYRDIVETLKGWGVVRSGIHVQ